MRLVQQVSGDGVLGSPEVWDVLTVPIRLDWGGSGIAQPVRFGVPVPKGSRFKSGEIQFSNGLRIPVQIETTCRWPDGSDQWVLVDAILPADNTEETAELLLSQASKSEHVTSSLKLDVSENCIQVHAGKCDAEINRDAFQPLSLLRVDGRSVFGGAGAKFLVTDESGTQYVAECFEWSVETAGPIRTTLLGQGHFPELRGLLATLRVSFYAESSCFCLDVTIHNPNRAKHPGGLWDLGDPGSLLIQDASLEFDVDEVESVRFSLDGGKSFQLSEEENWSLYQDSSGGDAWDSENHVNRDGVVKNRFRGFVVKDGSNETNGLRAEPIVDLALNESHFAVAFPEFWQQFPKAISLTNGSLRVGLFPGEFDDLHELQGGEQKTHKFWLNASSDENAVEALRWVYQPARVSAEPQWIDDANVLHSFRIEESERRDEYEELLTESVLGKKGVLANREVVDEYGWRNFGEVFADHEQAYYKGSKPLISHFNNQYDMIYGFLLHYLRTGDEHWWNLGDELARHVADIDIYHTTQDRAAYNGGLFWLTDHYLHASTATHRTYSKTNVPENGIYGGGPGSEHNFTSGLMLHYELTGNQNSKSAVRKLADWVISMEDGSQNVMGLVTDAPTGNATGSPVYQGPNRGGGNSINSLLDAWILFEEEKYLQAAETLLRRTVHPNDDVSQHDLLDVENRWSYTIFLTAMVKYLDLKNRAQQLDANYAYAQAALVQYAEWMLENEKPYFDQEEKLEFPTEAWAVQEFRKANVLRQAASHAQGELGEKLWNKGEELANRAWSDLLRFETRTYARALAIMMVEGLKDGVFRTSSPKPAPRASEHDYENFGSPVEFIPQKVLFKRQLKSPVGLAKTAASLLNISRWIRFLNTRN